MIKGTNSTVMVREGTISALNLLCSKSHLSKVDFITYIVAYLESLPASDLEDILAEGKMIVLISAMVHSFKVGKKADELMKDVWTKLQEANK